MAIDIEIRDKIADSIKRKIKEIGQAAVSTDRIIKQLKASLNFNGNNFNQTAIGLQKLQREYDKTQISAARSFKAQENALNSVIVSEQKAIQATNKRVTADTINNNRIQQSAARTAATVQTANNQIAASAARVAAAQARASAATVKSQNDITRSALSVQASQSNLARLQQQNAAKTVQAQQSIQQAYQKTSRSIISTMSALARLQVAQTKAATAAQTQASIIATASAKAAAAQSNAAAAASRAATAAVRTQQAQVQLALASQRTAAASNNVAAANGRLAASYTFLKSKLLTTTSTLTAFEQSLIRTGQRFRTFASGLLLIGATAGIAKTIDTYQDLQNQLRQNSDSQAQLNRLTEEIFNIAQRARVPLDGLAKVFRRIDDAIKPFGGGQVESLAITETLSKLLTLSGANAGEAASALLQLSQAFNKGKLDGDEFRSVAELMPAVLDAVAKSMGVARGALFDLSQQGKITTTVLRKSLGDIQEKVSLALETLPRTAGQATTQLLNAIKFGLGKTSTESGFISGLNSVLDTLRNNLDIVGKAAIAFGVAMGSIATVGVLGYLISLLNPLSNLSSAVLLVVTYFTYYSKEIKVAGENSASLHSTVKAMAVLIGDFVSKYTKPIFGDLFSVEGAQRNFDIVKQKLESLIDVINRTIASTAALSAAVGNIFSQAGEFGGIGQLLVNISRMTIVFGKTLPGAIELTKGAIESFVQVANLAFKNLFDALKGFLNNFITASEGLASAFPGANIVIGGFEKLRSLVNGLTFEEAKSGINDVAKAASGTLAKALTIAVAPSAALPLAMKETDDVLRGLADIFKDNLLFTDFDKVGKNSKSSAEVAKKAWEDTYSALKKGQADFFKEAEYLAKGYDADNAQRKAASEKAAKELKEAGVLRPEDFGIPGLISGIDQAVESSKRLSEQFGGIVEYAANLQIAMRSINAQGFKDLADFQKTQSENEITQAVGSNPLGEKNRLGGQIFTDKFISDSTAKVQAAQAEIDKLNTQAPQNEVKDLIRRFEELKAEPLQFDIPTDAINDATQPIDDLKTSMSGVSEASTLISTSSVQAFGSVAKSSSTTSQTIQTGFSSASSSAASSVSSFASSAVSQFNAVATAARDAANAAASIGGGGGRGGGSGPGFGPGQSGPTFSTRGAGGTGVGSVSPVYSYRQRRRNVYSEGGFTGYGSKYEPAGIVHRGEYVIPAQQTRKNRPLLEAIRNGGSTQSVSRPTGVGNGGSGGMSVTVKNYGGTRVETRQLSDKEIELIVHKVAPAAVAGQLANPNSKVSKSMQRNTTSGRRR